MAQTYYTLSYYSSNHNYDGKFRKIAVKVNRVGVKLRARAGYFAVADPSLSTGQQSWVFMEEALRNPMSYSGIAVTAALAPERNGQQYLVLKIARAPQLQNTLLRLACSRWYWSRRLSQFGFGY